jgi:predicted nuclease of predicted toxin-antitoxin system
VKIKLDENLPDRLSESLTALGHDVDSVMTERLAGRDDEVVWTAAQAAGRFLITQDLDFSDVRRYVPGTHHGLLLIRLVRPGRTALFTRIQSLFLNEPVETWEGCLVVATENKLRVKRSTK